MRNEATLKPEQFCAASTLLGWSQSQFAVHLGETVATVKQLESNGHEKISDELRDRAQIALEWAGIVLEDNGSDVEVSLRTGCAPKIGRSRKRQKTPRKRTSTP